MKPVWLVNINVSKFQQNFPRYEFSVLLFMFVHEHLRFREVALKCDIVGKEDNYKYLHCTRITLGNDLLFLFVNFFFASLFLRNL